MQKPGRYRLRPARRSEDGPTQRPRILVLGAGYGGLTCFLELQDHLPRGYDLLLINSDPYHWFTTELHTYVAGMTEDAVRIPLKRLVRRPGRLVVDRVTALDPTAHQVELKESGHIDYDLLVFALGSDPEYYGIPGVAEHSLMLGNWQAATDLRQRLRKLVAGREHPPHVVVAGGGLTGVEVAGELADQYAARIRLTILEAGPEIMAGFEPELVRLSRQVMEGKGVRIMTGNPIVAVDQAAIQLKKGEQIPYDLFIWAGGVRGSHLLAQSGLTLSNRGRAKVDPFLRSVDHQAIYLVGDSASLTDPETGREVPPSGQVAVQMGRAAGRNILRRLRGQPELPFTFRKRGMFASLGRHQGVGQIGQESFAGLPAMLVKHLIEGHHAWEMGSGVMPLIRKLLESPVAYLAGRRAYRAAPRAALNRTTLPRPSSPIK